MTGSVSIVDAQGNPMWAPVPSFAGGRNRPLALVGGNRVAFDAADGEGDHMAAWQPYLWSPDGELNPYRDRIVSRVRDMVRNDGWASGAVTRILDNAIGASFRPIAKPDYRALRAWSGLKTFDATWADEFGKAVSSFYRGWAMDLGCYCDVQRNMTLPQQMWVAFRHKIVDGDALAMLHWLPERVSPGRARFATSVQLIDPDRLSNPQLNFDQQIMRGGVEVDQYDAAVAYWIRRAHQGDWWSAGDSMRWDRIPRETEWGRPIIVHDFDHTRAGQHRGGAGVLAPVLQRLKMLVKYDSSELDAAIINAIFGAYIESPYDHEAVEMALGEESHRGAYQKDRIGYHDEHRMMLGGARLPIMFPGEKIGMVNAARPNSNFAEFESTVLRNTSAATGLSEQQITWNYANVNYSSARAALLEAWKTLHRRRIDFAVGFARRIYAGFVEELFEAINLPLPQGAPDFIDCRTEYARAEWMGPGRGWVDPVAEKKGAVLGMDAGLGTLENEAAEMAGADWEELLDQRKLEVQGFIDRGLTPPSWAGMQDKTAEQTIADPVIT